MNILKCANCCGKTFFVSASPSHFYRNLTTTEVSTALRPFYFSVHPDLFGQHPKERIINENSLKQLSSYIENLQSRRFIVPCNLQFYIKIKQNSNDNNVLRPIRIFLKENDIRKVVLHLLKSCDLPTDYVDKIPVQKSKTDNFQINFDNLRKVDPLHGPIIMEEEIRKKREQLTLCAWLDENYTLAKEKSDDSKPIRDEILRLKQAILDKWEVLEVKWDCGWNETHFRGCLQSFHALAEQHPISMNILRGRILVFGQFTGVSLDGHIMLYTGEVRDNWLHLIKNVKKYDEILLRIPGFEKTVSQVLRDIQVVRRKFMPKILAGEYERQLQQLTTNLSDYHGMRGYPSHWPNSLEEYQIVVETEAGPLMLSPTGQFIVPSSCPGSLLISFISGNLTAASNRLKTYKTNKNVERFLRRQCIKEFSLESLHKDDNVTPDIMIQCCENFIKHRKVLTNFNGLRINISTYYSVLSDGEVCIPWNWNL